MLCISLELEYRSILFMSEKDSQAHQLVYYQPGIGTYTNSSFITPLTTKVSKVLDEMLAWNLQSHVQGSLISMILLNMY